MSLTWLKSRKLAAFGVACVLIVVGALVAKPIGMSEVTFSAMANALVWVFAGYTGTNVATKVANRLPTKGQALPAE